MNIFSQARPGVWDVFEFGAKGDGKTKDTEAIQAAIDECHRAGGGKVYLHNGRFLSGTICLKSHVTLHIELGAVLLGSASLEDFPAPALSGEYNNGMSLIYAENAENISITGAGTIDGRGDVLYHREMTRPHIIFFRGCTRVKVRDIKLYNAAFWVQKYQSCKDVLIDGVTVDSRENADVEKNRYADVPGRNTDGCNIVDCSDVRISNCYIVSGDDGIVFKSFSGSEGCHQVVVSNCIISTNAAGIKIGTETAGPFRDFAIINCVVYDTRGAGIGIMTVDGATIERIIISNITLRNIKGAAVFVRVGNRARTYREGETAATGTMKDVLIRNIYGTGIERYGCSITGIPGMPVKGITLENIRLTFRGGNDPLYFEGYEDRPVWVLTVDNVPEMETAYPRSEMFGKLPAYGFYIRHAVDIGLDQVQLDFEREDRRPAIVADEVQGLFMDRLQAQGSSHTPCLIHLQNVSRATISGSETSDSLPVFLYVSGNQTKNVRLISNRFPAVRKAVEAENTSLLNQVEVKN